MQQMARPRTTNKHLPKYVTVIHGSYWYRVPGKDAVRIAKAGDEQTLYMFMAKRAEPAGPVQTLSDVFDRYTREVLPTLAPRTQKDYRRHMTVLRAWCGHMRPDELQPRDIGKFLDVDKGKIQKNRQVAVLSAIYAKAVGRWYVAEKNPCRDVERNPSKKRDRYVTDVEYMAIYELAPVRIQIGMDLALLTGQRQGDLLGLKWESVTEDGVLFRQGKTGKRLLVGISPSLKAVLERAKRLLPDLPREYVLRTRSGKPYSSEGFRAVWQRLQRRAKKQGKIAERYTFHDLRAKSVSDSASLEQAFERAGHTSMAMTRGTYDRGIRKVTPLK
jgi:integrase